MKAYTIHNRNDLRYEEIEKPGVQENTVIVSVKAAGICGSDIARIYGTGAYNYPLIPGHEFAGVVEEVQAGKDRRWAGKRVGVFPLIPCRKCEPCRNEQYEMCKNYNYIGSRTNGGFAEYVRVPAGNLIEISDQVSMEQAAILEPMAVAVHAIRRSCVKKSDRIAVCGLGTIGLFAVMFLREMGYENILAIGNKKVQRELAGKLGIQKAQYCDACGCDVNDWIEERTDGNGVDVFFECVGKQETLIHSLNGTNAGGKIQLVGNPITGMELPKDIYWKILRKQLTVCGTWNSSFYHSECDDWHYVLDRLKRKKICPEQIITHRFGMEELQHGFELMRDKQEDYVKVIGVF